MSRVEVAMARGARRLAPIAAAVSLCAVAVTVALASPSSTIASTGTTGATGTTGTTGTTVATHHTKRGKVLSTSKGHSLYLFTFDRASKSRCSGKCARTWKPLLTTSRPAAAPGSGVNAKLLGTTTRANHTRQVTYKGHPLYTYVGDKRAGQINGQNKKQFGGHWYLVNTRGNAVKPPARCNPASGNYCPLGSF